MAGAGLAAVTGTSWASGVDRDFFAARELNDTVSSDTPSTYSISHVLSGNASSLASIDRSYLLVGADSHTTTTISQHSTFNQVRCDTIG